MAAAFTEKSNIVLTGKEPFALDVTGAAKFGTAIGVANGGTGATTLTGYVKGSGAGAMTASSTIPGSDVSGSISGSAANVTGVVAVTNGGSGATSLTGYVKGNGTSAFTGSATVPGSDVSGNISGNAANVTGVVAIANGGTGATTAAVALTNLGAASSTHVHGNITNAGAIGSTANLPIITTASGVLAAGSFGTAANTFCQGNDSRLSDARTPTSHVHGNITNAGAIGSTANLPIITTASGVLAAGSFGTAANTFCQGNDSRLSDARTPTSHVLATASGLGGEHTVSGLASGQVLKAKSATTAQFEAVAFSEVTGTAAVSQGGTGATTLTGYVKGSGTSAMTASATVPGSDISGNIGGNAANVTGTVAVANGGTGTTTGSITGTGALTFTAGGTNTNINLAPNGTGTVDVGSKKITNLATPTADADAATKAYVDAVKQGLDVKDSVRAATTANITLSGAQNIDGVSVIAGDRVLVKDQSTGSQNGIYVAASGSWTRATDADASSEVTAGMFTFVAEGTANADSGWILTTNDAITLGTTSLAFTQFSGAGQITAGDGLAKTGNKIDVGGTADRITVNPDSIDIASTYAGQTTITTLGTVATGTWNATTIGVSKGGTGATTLTGYVKGSGTSAMTASSTIPGSDVSGNISGNAANVTGTVAVANGGTGAANAAAARTNLQVPYTFGTGGTSIVAWQSGDNISSGNWSAVAAGRNNTSGGNYSVVAGGSSNASGGIRSAVGGGAINTSSGHYATVGGGLFNTASGRSSTVGGGEGAAAGNNFATVGGGYFNTASGYGSVVAGGGRYNAVSFVFEGNTAVGDFSAVGGGAANRAEGFASAVSGGEYNASTGSHAATGGGRGNTASGYYSAVGGGNLNTSSGTNSAVGGGNLNTSSGTNSAVGGGFANRSSGGNSTVGGGWQNNASGGNSTVGGGKSNNADGLYSTVGGGQYNTSGGMGSVVAGGGWYNSNTYNYEGNTASGNISTVGGGAANVASNFGSTVGGGWKNTSSSYQSTVCGGYSNIASGNHSAVGGGRGNTSSGIYSFIGGGMFNTASGSYATVAGGQGNIATHDNVFLLGSSLVSDANDTTYVENLRVKGGFNTGVTLGTGAFPTGKISIRSAIVDLKTVASTTIFTVPTGYMFLIDTMEVVTTSITTAGTAPTVQFGNTGASAAYYGPTQITSNSLGARHIVENPQDGVAAGTAITMGITVGSTASAHGGVGIVTGYLLKNS